MTPWLQEALAAAGMMLAMGSLFVLALAGEALLT